MHLESWKGLLVVLGTMLPVVSLIVLLLLRTRAIGFLEDHGVKRDVPWKMRNQIRRMPA